MSASTPATRAPRPPRRRTEHKKDRAREASIERILDAAEQLFAELGYDGVTVKDVARKIDVSPTLLHYHFSGKESIFEAVWARKGPASTQRRLEALHRYSEKAGNRVTIEGALGAWINTILEAQIEDRVYWAAFGRIAAQANSSTGWGPEKATEYFDPVALALIELLKKALPGADEKRIFWGYHFLSGAMTHNLARTGRLDQLSAGLCSSDDFESMRANMVTFMTAGLRAICSPSPL